jgi:hypothetical protein
MYFGKNCHFFCGQWERDGEEYGEEPVICFCSNSKNEKKYEGNCCERSCPLSYKDSDFSDSDNSDNLNKTAIQMINIPTAKEARKSADSSSYSKAITQIEKIKKQINEAILEGKTGIGGDGHLEKAVKDRLESLGYECKTASQYNEDYYTIGW